MELDTTELPQAPSAEETLDTRVAKLKQVLPPQSSDMAAMNDNALKLILHDHKDLPFPYIVDFLAKAYLTGADPRLNQIHLTSYFSTKKGHKVGATVWSYHWMNERAARTGERTSLKCTSAMESVFDPITGKAEEMLVATALVGRKGEITEFKARWKYCYNAKSDLWRDQPYEMLQKTAIANCLRWAFPEILGNCYIDGEIIEREDSKSVTQNMVEQLNNRTMELPPPAASTIAFENPLPQVDVLPSTKSKKEKVKA